MQKVWYIKVNNHREGPFSVADLKRDRRVTPDTLVWREGFTAWKPIREVPELKKLFVDSEEISPETTVKKEMPSKEEIVLEMGQEPPYLFWILVVVVVLIYALSRLYLSS